MRKLRRSKRCGVDGVDTRYVQHRVNADGSERTYWIRPGHPPARLSKGIWAVQATSLNKAADAGEIANARDPNTIGWLIEEYRRSDWFGRRKPKTREMYEIFLRRLDGKLTTHPVKALTPRVCAEFVGQQHSVWMKKAAAAVLANLATVARQNGFDVGHPTADLKLETPRPRTAVWQIDTFGAFMEASKGHEYERAARTTAGLLLYTGQRPGDVIQMRRTDIDRDVIQVVQEKTGRKLWIPIHARLRPFLVGDSLTLVADALGRPVKEYRYDIIQREVRAKAGLLHLQMRDLRRTAVTMLREAGVSLEDICTITGHTMKEVQSILETVYWQPSEKQARRAIAAWERMDDEESNALDKSGG